MAAGSAYVNVPGTDQALITLALNTETMGATAFLDNQPVDLTGLASGSPLTLDAIDPGNHSLYVYFATASTAKGSVNATQSPGGSVLLQYNGSTTMTEFTNLVYGSNVGIKVVPRSDYKVDSVVVNNAESNITCSGNTGEECIGFLTVGATTADVTANFSVVPNIKVALAYPQFVEVGTPVTVNANGTTSNDTGLQYAFALSAEYTTHRGTTTVDESQAASDAASYTFTPEGATDYHVAVTVTTANGGSVTKNITIGVKSTADVQNKLCLSCHTGSTPEVIAELAAGNHSTRACVDCHTDTPHGVAFDGQNCVNCHHNKGPEAAVMTSKHGELVHNDENLCQRCHTMEGARAFENYTGDVDALAPIETLTAINPELTSAPTCAACHDEHVFRNAEGTIVLRTIPNWDPNGNGEADQFDLCTSCHVLYNQDGKLTASGLGGTAEFQHGDAWYRTIASTHYDNPATGYGLATNIIEGYNLRTTSENPCFDCHGHNLTANTRPGRNATINTQWALSGHAGKLLEAKYEKDAELALLTSPTELDHNGNPAKMNRTAEGTAEIMAVGSTTANAWAHYPWNNTSARGDCQECHTATGFMNRVDNPDTYTPDMNDFSYLKNWSKTTGSPQAELLYCWACHTSAESGELRAESAFTLDYTYNSTPIVIEADASNTCVNCHAGRGNDATIKTTAAADRSSRFQGHHGTAAGTVFSSQTHIAYEFSGQSYANVSYFEHNIIGLENGETEGPCVACHMGVEKDHTWEVVEKDANGVITALKSTTCYQCHSGAHGAALVTEDTVDANGVTHTAADAAAFLQEESPVTRTPSTFLAPCLPTRPTRPKPTLPPTTNRSPLISMVPSRTTSTQVMSQADMPITACMSSACCSTPLTT